MIAKQSGFTLVSAVFLLVVLVVLAVSLVTMSASAHISSAQQLQAARANYAARAGIEWAAAEAATPGGCPAGPTTLAPGGSLAGFSVTVTCTRTVHALPEGTQAYYVVDVTATYGAYGSTDFVQRRVETKMLGPLT